MSSNELISEILGLSSGLESFSNFQILNIDQANSLFSFAPELVQFASSCGSELNQLLELSESSVFNQLIETNLDLAGSLSPCLAQLLSLEQLVSSGNDVQLSDDNDDVNNSNNVNNNLNISNSTNVSNSTASVSSASNSTTAVPSNSTTSQGRNDNKGKDKKKNVKRGEIMQRSGASKRQFLGGLSIVLMVVVGAFAL